MSDLLEIALAGCLHDIGKLLQRAGSSLSDSAPRMEQMICPTGDGGRSTHRHVLWTNDFLDRAAWLPASVDRAKVNTLASAHHRPSSPLEWIIAEADRLASGHDRRPAEQEADGGFLCVPLSSIFTSVRLRPGAPNAVAWYRPDHRLADSVRPETQRPVPNLQPCYAAIADKLIRGTDRWGPLPHVLLPGCVASLSAECCGMTPASTIDQADVSLHDHNMLVAAIAAAMFQYHNRAGTLDESSVRNRSLPKYRLVCGDLSGIQSFIFAAAPEGARKGIARTFRARSFYLSMLTRVATIELLHAAGLPAFNRVIDAGGRFVLLVDNSDETLEKLRECDRRFQQWLVENHHGRLTLNIDCGVTARGEDFLGDRFGRLYRRIQAAADAAKCRRLAGWLQADGAWAEESQCLRRVNYRQWQETTADLQWELGRRLPDADYVGLFAGSGACPGLLADEGVPLFDHSLQLLDAPDEALKCDNLVDLFAIRPDGGNSSAEWIARLSIANHVPRLSPADVKALAGRPADDGGGGQETARDAGDLATFEDLARLAEGASMIAVLKADVDRLGMLFSRGFADHASFGRIATLSRMMDEFFKAFLPARLQEPDSPFRHVYTIFAGGDDLLLVGPWNVMLDLAVGLHDWFAGFACDNPDVTLSAALVLGKPKTPITALGRLAEEQLEMAKKAGRNRIAVLSRVFTWDDYRRAIEAGRRLSRLADPRGPFDPPLSRAFLYELLQVGRQIEDMDRARTEGRAVPLASLAWRSHLAYDFRRNVLDRLKHHRQTPELENELNWLCELMGIHVARPPADGRTLRLAATYALYLNRGGNS